MTAGLVVLAGLGVLVLVAVGAVKAAYRPRRVEAGPATTELGPEPPAVVHLVTNGWRVDSEAVPATVLDLAARRLVDIVDTGGGNEVIELRRRAGDPGPLTPYERQVLDHLRRIAVDGVVPAAALHTGPADVSDAWWRAFRRAVVADASARGLTRPRYPASVLAALAGTLGGLVAATVALLAVLGDDDEPSPVGWAIAAVFVVLVLGFTALGRLDRQAQRDTPTGRTVAARWLGVRQAYADNGAYRELPPAAVVLHERHLAHAAALGVARVAVERLPLGAEDDRHAWSNVGGRWRRVTVSYPKRRRGWGDRPGHAVAVGLVWTATLALPVWILARLGLDVADSVQDALRDVVVDTGSADDDALRWFALGIAAVIALVVVVVTANAVVRGVLPLVRGVRDLLAGDATVTGTVVRARTFVKSDGEETVEQHYAAVDTGRHDRIEAWRVADDLVGALRQGRAVTVTVTRHLGHVRAVRPAGDEPPLPPPAPGSLVSG
jgi:hypothetical protein